MNAVQNSYIGFSKLWVFDPKIQRFDFSKINAQKIQKFIDIQKTRIYVIELRITNSCIKFQANIFLFGCAMAQKPGKCDDVTFLIDFFLHF